MAGQKKMAAAIKPKPVPKAQISLQGSGLSGSQKAEGITATPPSVAESKNAAGVRKALCVAIAICMDVF